MAIPRFTIGHISDNTRVTLVNTALHCTVNNNHVREILHYYARRHNDRNAHPCNGCNLQKYTRCRGTRQAPDMGAGALQVRIAFVGWFYVHSGFNLLQSVGYVIISGHKTDGSVVKLGDPKKEEEETTDPVKKEVKKWEINQMYWLKVTGEKQ